LYYLAELSPIVFSTILPRPPSTPLFPYTTLFRSKPFPNPTLIRHELHFVRLIPNRDQLDAKTLFVEGKRIQTKRLRESTNIALPDRKSTRLNSSHGSISYAVFCLKKKNKKT